MKKFIQDKLSQIKLYIYLRFLIPVLLLPFVIVFIASAMDKDLYFHPKHISVLGPDTFQFNKKGKTFVFTEFGIVSPDTNDKCPSAEKKYDTGMLVFQDALMRSEVVRLEQVQGKDHRGIQNVRIFIDGTRLGTYLLRAQASIQAGNDVDYCSGS